MLYLTYERPTSFEVFLTKVRHIVRKMYNGNDQKVEDIYILARYFRKYLIAEEVASEIETFINDKQE
jgi:predicted nucleic acid-binding protein